MIRFSSLIVYLLAYETLAQEKSAYETLAHEKSAHEKSAHEKLVYKNGHAFDRTLYTIDEGVKLGYIRYDHPVSSDDYQAKQVFRYHHFHQIVIKRN